MKRIFGDLPDSVSLSRYEPLHRGRPRRFAKSLFVGVASILFPTAGLRPTDDISAPPPDIRPDANSLSPDSLALDASQVRPMYQELLPVDLYSVLRVVAAENIDIQLAKYQVDQRQGR